MTFRQQMVSAFLDYFNNYATVEAWARDNHLSNDNAKDILKRGHDLHRADTDPENKANALSDFNPHR